MNPIDFKEKTNILKRPKDMAEDECNPLPVRIVLEGQSTTFISCWEPTEEDRKAIAEGKPVWLGVLSSAHPPVWLTTRKPPQMENLEQDRKTKIEALIIGRLHEFAGEASMCWKPLPSTEIFDATAAAIASKLAAADIALILLKSSDITIT
jgi:hypothetical protein